MNSSRSKFRHSRRMRVSTVGAVQPAHLGGELQKLAAGELVVEERLLGHVADRAGGAADVADQVVPAHPHRARRRPQQSGEHLDGGRLAGPVGPQQREQLARRNRQRQPVHGDLAGVGPRHVVELNHGSRPAGRSPCLHHCRPAARREFLGLVVGQAVERDGRIEQDDLLLQHRAVAADPESCRAGSGCRRRRFPNRCGTPPASSPPPRRSRRSAPCPRPWRARSPTGSSPAKGGCRRARSTSGRREGPAVASAAKGVAQQRVGGKKRLVGERHAAVADLQLQLPAFHRPVHANHFVQRLHAHRRIEPHQVPQRVDRQHAPRVHLQPVDRPLDQPREGAQPAGHHLLQRQGVEMDPAVNVRQAGRLQLRIAQGPAQRPAVRTTSASPPAERPAAPRRSGCSSAARPPTAAATPSPSPANSSWPATASPPPH